MPAVAATPAPATPPSPFALRGIKGLWWDGIEKYRLALPWVADHNLNFLMLCYSSFPASGKDWRSDYSPAQLAAFRELAAEADRRGVELCLSFNPGIWSKPPLVYSSEGDYQLALKKVKDVAATGVRSFALCLDDINGKLQPADEQKFKTLQAAQVSFVNRLWTDMKTISPRPKRLIFCPSAYTTRDAEQHLDYIEAMKQIDPQVQMFWTGPVVCSPTITAADARKFAAWIGRKPIVWDNYPVNDMFPWRPLLAATRGRSSDLAGAVDGFMSNPMKQWHASKIPLATTAAYLNDPEHYDPAAAMMRVVDSFDASQRPAIRQLLDLYGATFLGEKSFPPGPKNVSAQEMERVHDVKATLAATKGLEDLNADVAPTLDADLEKLKRALPLSR